jgi:hypothetical protein
VQPLDVDSLDLFGQRIRPVLSAPNQLLAALHWECSLEEQAFGLPVDFETVEIILVVPVALIR